MISERACATLNCTRYSPSWRVIPPSPPARSWALELQPSTEIEEAQLWQRETAEALELLEERASITLRGARDVREPVIKSLRGVVIEASILLDILYTLRRATTLKRTLGRMAASYPLLAGLGHRAANLWRAASANRPLHR